jgi:hypothetical protein
VTFPDGDDVAIDAAALAPEVAAAVLVYQDAIREQTRAAAVCQKAWVQYSAAHSALKDAEARVEIAGLELRQACRASAGEGE